MRERGDGEDLPSMLARDFEPDIMFATAELVEEGMYAETGAQNDCNNDANGGGRSSLENLMAAIGAHTTMESYLISRVGQEHYLQFKVLAPKGAEKPYFTAPATAVAGAATAYDADKWAQKVKSKADTLDILRRRDRQKEEILGLRAKVEKLEAEAKKAEAAHVDAAAAAGEPHPFMGADDAAEADADKPAETHEDDDEELEEKAGADPPKAAKPATEEDEADEASAPPDVGGAAGVAAAPVPSPGLGTGWVVRAIALVGPLQYKVGSRRYNLLSACLCVIICTDGVG